MSGPSKASGALAAAALLVHAAGGGAAHAATARPGTAGTVVSPRPDVRSAWRSSPASA